jgi:hypothetical protein
MIVLGVIGSAITLLFGLWSAAQPTTIANAVGIQLTEPRSRAEFRIAFGGFFTGMGLAGLLLQTPDAFLVLGLAWLGGGVLRLLSIVLDKPELDAGFFGFFASEVIVGGMLILPWLMQ